MLLSSSSDSLAAVTLVRLNTPRVIVPSIAATTPLHICMKIVGKHKAAVRRHQALFTSNKAKALNDAGIFECLLSIDASHNSLLSKLLVPSLWKSQDGRKPRFGRTEGPGVAESLATSLLYPPPYQPPLRKCKAGNYVYIGLVSHHCRG